ncbi:MAG TPA: 5-oxoprolinase subunit PxpA [Jatrophihabitantaceae bacterium]
MRIDLNADLGEGFGAWTLGDDDALLDVITSANVACGFHAGDPRTMQRVCARAHTRGVAIGAQVGYRDLAGFGRRRIDVAPDDLSADVLYQLGALDAFARVAGTRVRYVKPHGALYNTAADDEAQAGAVAGAVARYDAGLPLLGLPSSALESAARRAGIPFVAEAFADRAYTPDGRLVPRTEPGAVHSDEATVVAQAVRFATEGHAASVCLHGDTPGAVALARAVRAALEGRGVTLASFAPIVP